MLKIKNVCDNTLALEIPKSWNAQKFATFCVYYDMWLQYFDVDGYKTSVTVNNKGLREIQTNFDNENDAMMVALRNPTFDVEKFLNN